MIFDTVGRFIIQKMKAIQKWIHNIMNNGYESRDKIIEDIQSDSEFMFEKGYRIVEPAIAVSPFWVMLKSMALIPGLILDDNRKKIVAANLDSCRAVWVPSVNIYGPPNIIGITKLHIFLDDYILQQDNWMTLFKDQLFSIIDQLATHYTETKEMSLKKIVFHADRSFNNSYMKAKIFTNTEVFEDGSLIGQLQKHLDSCFGNERSKNMIVIEGTNTVEFTVGTNRYIYKYEFPFYDCMPIGESETIFSFWTFSFIRNYSEFDSHVPYRNDYIYEFTEESIGLLLWNYANAMKVSLSIVMPYHFRRENPPMIIPEYIRKNNVKMMSFNDIPESIREEVYWRCISYIYLSKGEDVKDAMKDLTKYLANVVIQ